MKCIYCNQDTHVTDKRNTLDSVRRRRECLKCKKRFTTYEKPVEFEIFIVKKDNRRERYSKDKLKNGILKACEKRSVSIKKINKILDEIEEKLRKKGKEVKSEKIGKMVMQKLKKLDKVAYIRFASVYKDFQDIKDFKEVIKEV